MVPDPSTIPPAVTEVLTRLKGAGHAAFLVGGCVRDMFRKVAPKDFDVATAATPPQVQALFKRVIPTGIDHGTVTVVTRGLHVEVTTFRSEGGYHDGRRPSKVEFHTDIEADLSRRDFTINAMAYDPLAPPPADPVVDPFGGRADLKAKVVRCVRDAHERFSEDGLRALRAVRFATVLDFTLDPDTEKAIPPTMPVFRKVALERVNQELTRLLLAPHAPTGLGLLERTTLLDEIAPEAKGADFAAVGRAPPELPLRLAVLFVRCDRVRDVLLRLKFPNKVADDAAQLVRLRELPPADASDAQLRRWLSKVGAARAEPILELNRALGEFTDSREVDGSLAEFEHPPDLREERVDVNEAVPTTLEARLHLVLAQKPPLTTRELALDGSGIMAALNVGPSAIVGQATRHLLELVLDDPGRNTPQALTDALRTWQAGAR